MLRLGRGGLHGARDLRRQLRDDQRHEARRVQRAGGGGGGRAHAAQGALAQPCGGEGSGVRLCLCIYYYLPSTLLLSTPKPSCPDDKEDVESNLFPEAEDSEEKLCWLETEAEEEEEEEAAPTAAWTAWATWGWMASRICCTRLPLAREAWAWEEKEESREAARDEEELEEELEEEEEEELEEEEETDNSLVAFST